MSDRGRDSKQESIERLIDAEIHAALAEFRSGHFEADVRKKIRGMGTIKKGIHFAGGFRRPVWIAAGLVLLAGAIMLTLLFHRTPRPAMARAVEAVLQQAPGIAALEYRLSQRNQEAKEIIASPMNSQIQTVLWQRGLNSGAAPDDSLSRPKAGRGTRPMTLEEMYKILVIDKTVERVLALVS